LLRKANKLCDKASSVLIGSGISADYKDMEALVGTFLGRDINVVLDAGVFTDKSDVLVRLKDRLKARKTPAVITPHIGEFARILGISNSEVAPDAENLASGFAVENNVVVVLKGSKTLIATPDGKIYVNDLANSGLAKGGSGDVLAGLIAGFLAQGMEPYKAACSAVYIHSKAGAAAADDVGARYMLPEDLIIYLPDGYTEAGWRD
jgi:NAD(P)H-hydrate epimerase